MSFKMRRVGLYKAARFAKVTLGTVDPVRLNAARIHQLLKSRCPHNEGKKLDADGMKLRCITCGRVVSIWRLPGARPLREDS